VTASICRNEEFGCRAGPHFVVEQGLFFFSSLLSSFPLRPCGLSTVSPFFLRNPLAPAPFNEIFFCPLAVFSSGMVKTPPTPNRPFLLHFPPRLKFCSFNRASGSLSDVGHGREGSFLLGPLLSFDLVLPSPIVDEAQRPRIPEVPVRHWFQFFHMASCTLSIL